MRSPFTDYSEAETLYDQTESPIAYEDLEELSPFGNAETQAAEAWRDEVDREEGFVEPMAEEEDFFDGEDERDREEESDFREAESLSEESLGETQWMETELKSDPQTLDFRILSADTDRLGKTIYINPDLKIQHTANLTGIFVPAGFKKTDHFELIIYLHGFKYDTAKGPAVCYKGICPTSTIESYWKNDMFLFREAMAEQGRNSILVAPTLGMRSEAGNLVNDRGFDLFINQVLRALSSENVIHPGYGPGRIILSAHSGGGAPMQRIAGLQDKYSRLIKECWCFDALYGDVSAAWCRWIKADPQRKFYTYYLGSGPTRNSEAIQTACKKESARIFLKSSGVRNHWDLVLPYWKERISAAGVQQEINNEYEISNPFQPETEEEQPVMEMEDVTPENSSSPYHASKLPADPNPGLDRFKRKVYTLCIQASQARARKGARIFIDDLPGYDKFPKIDGQRVHPAMLDSLQRMINAAAQAATARGDEIRIKVASGYRTTSGQFKNWNGYFYKYYDRGINGYFVSAKGQKKFVTPFLTKDDFSDASAQVLANYVGRLYGSPGYSNHNNGKAVDLAISGKENHQGKEFRVNLGPNSTQYATWRITNFWAWLKANAGNYEFEEYTVEPWHWNFTGRKNEETEIQWEEEIVLPEMEEELSSYELLEEGMTEQEDKKPSVGAARSIKLKANQAPLYYVSIDVTNAVDSVAFGHLWNQKFGWKNLLWELGKDTKDNQRRVDKSHPKLPIARLIRKQDGVTFADTCIVPQGVDGKGTDKLWAGKTSLDNQTDIDAACTFMQSFILNPSADKTTSSLNDAGTGVTADIVYISSHGLSTGDMFGEVVFGESVFALSKMVSLGAQFSGVGWLLLSNCSTLKPHTHEDWLKLMSGPVPLRGIVGFQDTCPLAPGSVKVFTSFIKRLAEGMNFINAWAGALAVRGLEDHWIVVCQEDAVDDKIADYNARALKKITPGGKIMMFNKANPKGVQVVPVADPFEVFWMKGGTRITPANRGVAANKLSVGDKVSITVRPPGAAKTFTNGAKIAITLVYVRLNHPQAFDITKIFKVASFAGVSQPVAADLNFRNTSALDGWEMVVSGTPKEVSLQLECKDLTGLHSNYIFWLDVDVDGNSHEFVHNGSISIS